MSLRLSIACFLAYCIVLLQGCDGGAPSDPVRTDIEGVLIADGEYDAFVDALAASGLDATLRGDGPFTVFAPTDLAFDFLGDDTVERLLDPANSELLQRIIRFHIVPGTFHLANLEAGTELITLDGTSLLVERTDEELRVGGALISDPDIAADNGVIHGLSDVLRMNLNTDERIRLTPILETFAGLVQATGASTALAGSAPITVFAPIDNAFVEYGVPEFDLLTAPENLDVLGRVLDFHIAEGLFDIPSLETGTEILSRDGVALKLSVEGSARYLGGRLIVSEPIETANGLLYLLNGVQTDSLKIAERLRINPRMTTFADLIVDRPDLLSALSSNEPYTVFAPLNVGYEAYPSAIREALFSPEHASLLDQLTRVHIVPGRFSSTELTEGRVLTALDGTELEVQIDGDRIFVGGRLLDTVDEPVQIGAFHRVAVLITPDVNLLDKLLLEGFTNQLDAISRAGLESLFEGAGPITLFTFPNEIYSVNPTLLGRSDLDQILLYHAAAEIVSPLTHGTVFRSIEGTNRTIAFDQLSSSYRLDGVGAILDYGSVRNGRLYSVDSLTLPPALQALN